MKKLALITFVVFIILQCIVAKPFKKHKINRHTKNVINRHRTQDGLKNLINNTPVETEMETTESFRKVNNDFTSSELERRTPSIGRSIVRKKIEKRTPSNADPEDMTSPFDNFEEASPMFWSENNKNSLTKTFIGKNAHKKEGADGPMGVLPGGGPDAMEPHITNEDSLDDMPNTAGPNPNIFGGFPENDVWGNFELPAPETIDHLKLALKMGHHRPNYGGDQASDDNDQLYNYEHHALPEYDIMETPPFQEVLWQNAQLHEALKAGARPACAPGMGSCPPVNAAVTCQNLHHACATSAQHPPHAKIKYAPPCAAKILALFGCGAKPKPPAEEPPPPHPEEPLPIPVKKPKPGDSPPPDKPPPDKPPPDKPPPDKPPPDKPPPDKPPPESKKKGNDIASYGYPLADLMDDSKTNTSEKSSDVIQTFHSKKKKKEKESRVGLMNPEQSLALMSAIGNDLEKSLSEKFIGENHKKKSKKKVHDKKFAFEGGDKKTPEADKVAENKPEADKVAENKPEADKVAENKTATIHVDDMKKENNDTDSHFSEWSEWTLCDKSCNEGIKTRRRECMAQDKDTCDGVMEEKSMCHLSKCTVYPTDKPASEESSVTTSSNNSNNSAPVTDPYSSVKITSTENADIRPTKTQNEMLSNAFDNLVVSRFSKEPTASNLEFNLDDTNTKSPKEDASVTQSQKKETPALKGGYQVLVAAIPQQVKEVKRQWSEWNTCTTPCGIGQMSRRWMCDANPCEDNEESTQTRSCRMKACHDQKLESALSKDCLSLHNELRRRHGADALKWSNELYQKALEVSDHLALNNIPMNNLTKYERPGLNLAYVSPGSDINDAVIPCTRAVEEWYGQKQNYNYQHPKLSTEDRDFAQLVWKSTKMVGISKSKTPDGGSYIAAVYDPAGNNDSFYDLRKNALPPVNNDESETYEFLDKLLSVKH